MPLTLPTWVTAIATVVLAIGAGITAIWAIKAFGKQTQELGVLEQQAKDQQALTGQQAELLKLQSGQLDLQRQQLGDQRQANERQAAIAELQAQELRESRLLPLHFRRQPSVGALGAHHARRSSREDPRDPTAP